MATQRRSWLARIGVVAIVAVGALVGVTTAASAAPGDAEAVEINLESPVAPGTQATLTFKIKNKASGTGSETFTISVDTASPIIAECTGACSKQVEVGNGQTSGQQTFTIATKNGGAGQGVNIRIRSGGQEIASRTLNVSAAQQSIGKIQGLVRNVADNKPIKAAIVTLVDGAGKQHNTQADGNGIYSFDGPAKKIAPGVIAITAVKSPFTMVGGGVAKTVTLAAGQDAIPLDLSMEDLTVSTPSPTPQTELTPTGSVGPTDTLEPVGENAPADEGGMDSMTLVMIIVGGLLVALGIGAIVLLLVRRNSDDDEDEEEAPVRGRPGPRGPAGAPQSGGGYRPTSPAGYGQPGYGARPADPTMVGNPQHGVPQQRGPQQPGYGAPTQQWNPQQTQGGGYGGPPQSGGGYGQPGYGQPGYDQGGYGGPPQSGGGYGQPGYAGGGQYDETTHYAPPTSGAGGYDQQGGYGQASYGQGGGYDQNGYAPPQGGYAQADGYGADPYGGQQGHQQDPYGGQPQPGYNDDRRNRGDRRLDWLDD